MTLDEEILFAKEEKEIYKDVEKLMETMNFSDLDEAGLLNLKYSETAEMLREFNYEKNVFDVLKEEKMYSEISNINKIVEDAKNKINNSTNKDCLLENYRKLAELKVIIERTLTKAMENGGKDLDEYQEKTGYSDNRYEDKAAEATAKKERKEMFKKAFFHGGDHLRDYQKKYNVSDSDYEAEAYKYSNRK